MFHFGENNSTERKHNSAMDSSTTKMANVSATSSAPSTPISTLPQMNPFMDINHQVDESTMWDLQGSPGSKRCPTFKDYAEKVKQLQQENFQLRVRIFMNEQKTGIKTSSSDLAVLFQQNFHQLQNAFNAHNISSNMTHSMTATSSCMSNDVLPPQLKSQNELLTTKVIEMEHKIHNYEVALKEKQADNDKLTEKYEHVLGQMQDFETELTLNKMKLQQVQNNQAQAKSSEEEVERAARIAFGQFDEDVGDSSRSNQDVEVKLVESNNKIQQLEKKLAKMQRDIEKYQKSLTAMEKEKKEADSKIVECSKAILEFGKRNLELKNENEALQHALHQQQHSINDNKVKDSTIMRKHSSIRESVSLLQSRLFEIIKFIETLFSLESKKVLALTGLSESNRNSLRVAVEQCKVHSHALDQLLDSSDDSDISRRLNMTGSRLDQNLTYNSHRYSFGNSANNTQANKSVGVQCKLLLESPVGRSKRESDLAETIRRLTSEQLQYHTKIASLESRLRSATDHIASLDKGSRGLPNQAYDALQNENKALHGRVVTTESALMKLHRQHAVIVSELKEMRNTHAEGFQDKETERPSDSTSPDLGIDSGHDGAVNSDDSNSSNNFKVENRALRNANRELAHKLRDTRQVLNNTLEKLHTTAKQKEQVEKAICRQLHKTHTILRQAKKSVENYTANQNLENMMPPNNAFNNSED